MRVRTIRVFFHWLVYYFVLYLQQFCFYSLTTTLVPHIIPKPTCTYIRPRCRYIIMCYYKTLTVPLHRANICKLCALQTTTTTCTSVLLWQCVYFNSRYIHAYTEWKGDNPISPEPVVQTVQFLRVGRYFFFLFYVTSINSFRL